MLNSSVIRPAAQFTSARVLFLGLLAFGLFDALCANAQSAAVQPDIKGCSTTVPAMCKELADRVGDDFSAAPPSKPWKHKYLVQVNSQVPFEEHYNYWDSNTSRPVSTSEFYCEGTALRRQQVVVAHFNLALGEVPGAVSYSCTSNVPDGRSVHLPAGTFDIWGGAPGGGWRQYRLPHGLIGDSVTPPLCNGSPPGSGSGIPICRVAEVAPVVSFDLVASLYCRAERLEGLLACEKMSSDTTIELLRRRLDRLEEAAPSK